MRPWPSPRAQKHLLQRTPRNVSSVQPPFDPSLDSWGTATNTFKKVESRCLSLRHARPQRCTARETLVFVESVGPYLDLMHGAGWGRSGTVANGNQQLTAPENGASLLKSA